MAARQASSNVFGGIGNVQLKKGIQKKEEVQSTETNPLLVAVKIRGKGMFQKRHLLNRMKVILK